MSSMPRWVTATLLPGFILAALLAAYAHAHGVTPALTANTKSSSISHSIPGFCAKLAGRVERMPSACAGYTTATSGTGGTGGGGAAGWSRAQLDNAHTIITVGHDMKVPHQAIVVALATAMQESSLLVNPPGHDHDSVGLFQQRPSQGWGSVADCRDPRHSARVFYTALLKVPGWQHMPVTRAAQAVQRSAYPDAYAVWEDDAKKLAA